MSKEKFHPIRIPGKAIQSNNEELGRWIGRLRYDQQPLILGALAKELSMQAIGDRGRGRRKLAGLLKQAQKSCEGLIGDYKKILELCRPYMGAEFKKFPEAKSVDQS